MLSDKKIRKLYSSIKNKAPKNLEDISEKYFMDNNFNKIGGATHGEVYKLSSDIVAKIPWDIGMIERKTNQESFHQSLKEYMIQRLSFEIGLRVPEPYGIVLIHNTNIDEVYFALIMQGLDGESLRESHMNSPIKKFPLEKNGLVEKRYNQEKSEVLKYVHELGSDISRYNAIWVPKEKNVYLIDCIQWEFKALNNKKYYPKVL